MKTRALVVAVAVIAAVVAVGCSRAATPTPTLTPTPSIRAVDVSVQWVKEQMDSNAGLFILDVRTPAEYEQGRLPGAVLIPVTELESRYGEVPTDQPVLVYCRTGSRSAQASALLASRGYENVHNMLGGIEEWQKLQYPITQ